MRRRKVSGVGDGVPEDLRYKTVAELITEGSMTDKIIDEYTEEELLAMSDEVEKESKCFASIEFSKYRSVSY